MTRFNRILKISLIIGTCTLFASVMALILYTNTAHFRNMVLAMANKAIPGTISVSRHALSLASGTLVLFDVSIAAPSGDVPAKIGQIDLRLSWGALLKREIQLRHVNLKSPDVHLVQGADGTLNIVTAFVSPQIESIPASSEAESDFPFNIVIRNAEISEGTFDYSAPGDSIDLHVNNIAAQGAFDLRRLSTDLELETGRLQLKSGSSDYELNRLHVESELKDNRLTIKDMEAGFGDSTLRITGSGDDIFAKPDLDAAIDLDAALKDIAILSGWNGPINGRVEGSILVKGGMDAPHIDVHLEYGGGQIFSQQIDGASLKAELADRLLTIKQFHVNTLGGRADLNGTLDASKMLPDGWIHFNPQLDQLVYELEMKLRELSLDKLSGMGTALNGAIGGKIHVKGQGTDPRHLSANTSVELTADRLSTPVMAQSLDGRVTGSATMSGGTVTLQRLNADLGEALTQLDVTGSLNVQDQTVLSKLNIETASLTDLLGVAGISNVKGGATLAMSVTGKLSRPDLHFSLTSTMLEYDNYRIGDVAASGHLGPNGVLEISDLGVKNQGTVIDGKGQVQLFGDKNGAATSLPLDFMFDFTDVAPQHFSPELPVTAEIDGQLHLGGCVKAPEADLELHAQALQVSGHDVGNVDTKLRYENGDIVLRKLKAGRGQSTLAASGRVSLLDPRTFKLRDNPRLAAELTGHKLVIEEFTPLATGVVDLRAQISGSIEDPAGDIEATASTIEVQGESIENIRLSAKIKDRKVHLSPLRINLTASDSLIAKGWIGLDRTFHVDLHSDGISLDQIRAVKDTGYAQGDLLMDISGQGSFTDPSVKGDARIVNLKLNGQALEDFILHLDIASRKARVKAAWNFNAKAEYAFDSGKYSLSMVFDQTALKPYFALLGQPDLTGSVTGVVNASGDLDQLKASRADIALSDLVLNFKKSPLLQTKKLNATLKNKGFDIQKTRLSLLTKGDLMIQGNGRFDGPVSMAVRGNVPFDIVDSLTDDVSDFNGQVLIDAQIAGRLPHPDINATLSFDKLGCTFDAIGEPLRNLNGQIRITPEQLVFDDLAGGLGSGTFSLGGRVAIKDWTPGDVKLIFNAHQLPVEIPDTMDLTTNTRLKLQGNADKSSLEGKIEILDGLYYKDVNTNPLKGITRRKRETAPARRNIKLPYLKNMALNVIVKRRNPFIVENNLAYLEISPDLQINGTLNSPKASGRAKVENGEIYYSGKTFIVKKGIVDFLNPYTIEPTVDIHSEVIVRDWLITLLVSGTPDNLKVELRSDPPEENADILSLLLLGKTTAELQGNSDVKTQSPAQMMTKLMASTFGEDIKKATGVDILEVETADGTDETASDLIKVTVGKKLSERLTVKYSVSSKGGESVQRAVSEYQFLDNIVVSGFQDTLGVYGGELVFRIEFR